MPLGTDVGLSPGNIVLDGDPAAPSSKRGEAASHFLARVLWPNSCMDQDATCMGNCRKFKWSVTLTLDRVKVMSTYSVRVGLPARPTT